MKLKSYINLEGSLQPLEVEVLTQKGLPQLQFVGLPDQVIKESAVRIKSAIKSCGFEWPQAKQIIVNLKPAHLRKSSRGLEFAVATAILVETGQLNLTAKQLETSYFYGELDLSGNIFLPEDLRVFQPSTLQTENLYTGQITDNSCFWSARGVYLLKTLSDLKVEILPYHLNKPWKIQRPTDYHPIFVSTQQKELLMICALGEHHSLFAGPSGTGKSLSAEILHSLRKFPQGEEELTLLNHQNFKLDEALWRPMIKPHHSLTLQGLLGGGQQLTEGELSRATGGTLVFDELLEFKPAVVEGLREPLETGQVRVARQAGVATFASDFLWIATTNLCPCGEFTPGKPVECRYSLTKCRSYSQKLSGPLVDRFDIISFTQNWKGSRIHSVHEILAELESLESFHVKSSRHQVDQEILKLKLPFVSQKLMDSWAGSLRRKKATLRVALTLAKLDQRNTFKDSDIERAMNYTVQPFISMQRWD